MKHSATSIINSIKTCVFVSLSTVERCNVRIGIDTHKK